MEIVFNTANFAYRQAGYPGVNDWGLACRTNRLYYSPIETLEERLGELLGVIDGMGFKTLDLWHFHVNQKWWTPEHVRIARSLLDARGMRVVSYCGGFGDTLEEFERTCGLANAMGFDLLAGACPVFRTDRAEFVAMLRHHGLRFAYENHPEKTPADLLAYVGDEDTDVVGVTVDTGWFGSQAYPADQAIRELGSRVMHVHLKDVRAAGAHETCGYGQGVVPVRGCVDALRDLGYTGHLSIEHEPEAYDPIPEILDAHSQLKTWLATPEVTA